MSSLLQNRALILPGGISVDDLLTFHSMGHQPDNIFAGTQVVSLVEVRGTNDSLVHLRAALNQLLVRFF